MQVISDSSKKVGKILSPQEYQQAYRVLCEYEIRSDEGIQYAQWRTDARTDQRLRAAWQLLDGNAVLFEELVGDAVGIGIENVAGVFNYVMKLGEVA